MREMKSKKLWAVHFCRKRCFSLLTSSVPSIVKQHTPHDHPTYLNSHKLHISISTTRPQKGRASHFKPLTML
ncbi:hypothetical protein VNO78_08206 [Psophocarpus tetragonolobus]|uniref:Uncharacterized protein n=1 Tax=Psophocarpus tetragonolobus TaxID=3891 RepID=A0AAN9T4R3_PSOTE